MLIVRFNNPRAIKDQRSNLPVLYRANKSCWMTGNIFKDLFHDHLFLLFKKDLTSCTFLESAVANE